MTHPIVGLVSVLAGRARAAARAARAAAVAVLALALLGVAACSDSTAPNDPADLPRESVLLSDASGLHTLITEESERIIPTLRATSATDDLADKMRLLGDALRTAGTPAVRDALSNLDGALQMYEGMTRNDAVAAAELGALKLAVDAVREALHPAR